jgi:hypothetical protein
MKFINEIANNWEVTSIVAEMDSVLKRYSRIVRLTALHEGQLDTISDDVISAVTEIQNRINVISKARDSVDGMAPDDQYKLARNKKFIMLALKRVNGRMDQFQELTKSELGVTGDETLSRPTMVEPDAVEPDAVEPDAVEPDSDAGAVEPDAVEPDSDADSDVEPVDIDVYGRQAPYLLNKAAAGTLEVYSDTFDKYLDTFENLVSAKLLTPYGKITPVGKASLAARSPAKKGSMSSSALSDLLNMD